MSPLAKFLLALILMPFTMMWSGFALSKLWAWFIVTTFGAPALSIPAAIGIAVVAGYLTYQYDAAKKADSDETYWNGIALCVLKPAFALLFGWIVSLFL